MRRVVGAVLTILCLTIVGIAFIGPFYWLIITSVKPRDQILTLPLVWWPREFQWRNFYDVWMKVPFVDYFRNTGIITVANLAGNIACATVVGYGFAVKKFWGRDVLFAILLATMMIPRYIVLIPLFVIFRYLNWLDTLLPLVVPSFFGVGGAFYIFLVRQFFLTIPIDLEESARIDGASTLRILMSIYLPLSVPALTTVAVFSFVRSWNDYFGPLIYLTSPKNWTLTVGLAAMQDPNFVDYRQQMAGAVLVSIPCVLVFFLAQRYFTEGVTLTGIKG